MSETNKIINVDYSSGRVQLKTPRLYIPFGVSVFESPSGTKYNIDLSIRGIDDPLIREFYNKIIDIDEKIVENAIRHKSTWFNEYIPDNEIRGMYDKSIKQNEPYAPQIRVRFSSYSNELTTDFKDDNGDSAYFSRLEQKQFKTCSAISYIELVSVIVNGDRFKPNWKFNEIQVFPAQRLRGYRFVD